MFTCTPARWLYWENGTHVCIHCAWDIPLKPICNKQLPFNTVQTHDNHYVFIYHAHMMFFTWWSVSCLRSVCSSIVFVCVYSSSLCSKDGLCDVLRVLALCQHLWKWQCVRKPRLEIEQDREKGREVFPTSYTSFCLSHCSVYHSAVYWQSLQKKL